MLTFKASIGNSVKTLFVCDPGEADFLMHTKLLRSLISGTDCHPAPGVFDGFSARIAAQAGAKVLHASGGAISRAIGYPDQGLISMTEMLNRMSEMVAVCDMPVFADADTGFGNTKNAARTARCYNAAGLAGLHIEDQTFPKRCGYMDGVAVIPASDMADKIKAMKDAVGDNLVIAARTDAVGIEGVEAALERISLYMDAGADMAFVEGIEDLPQLQAVAQALPDVPLVFNQAHASDGGALDLEVLAQNGVRFALYPGDLQRGAIWAMQQAIKAILKTGATQSVADHLLTNSQRDRFFD